MELQNLSERKHWQLSEKLKGKDEACVALQQKIRELEYKFKEQQNSESLFLQQKVKELEYKLKEQMHYELIATQKVKELELKLKEREQFQWVLEQKAKELEEKLKEEREHADSLRFSTPSEGKASSRDQLMDDIDPHILKSSSLVNKQLLGSHHGSFLLRGRESRHEIKRKREVENGMFGHLTSGVDKKVALPTSESSRLRKIDPTKAYGRFTRTSKVDTSQKIYSYGRTNSDEQQGGGKEERVRRGWVR